VAGNVQPTLEWAQPLCWAIRAAGSLKSGLALAPGSDPESASSFLRGLRLGGLVILFVARGGPRRGIGGGPVHHAGLNNLERLAGPSVPSSATPHAWIDLTPRSSQRAEQCCGMRLTQRECPVRQSGPAFMLKTGPELLIGPSQARNAAMSAATT
jgi:hypothetical protein